MQNRITSESLVFHQMKDIIAVKYKSPTCHLGFFFSSASIKYSFHLSERSQSDLVLLFVKGDRRLREQNFKHLILKCLSIKDTVLIT